MAYEVLSYFLSEEKNCTHIWISSLTSVSRVPGRTTYSTRNPRDKRKIENVSTIALCGPFSTTELQPISFAWMESDWVSHWFNIRPFFSVFLFSHSLSILSVSIQFYSIHLDSQLHLARHLSRRCVHVIYRKLLTTSKITTKDLCFALCISKMCKVTSFTVS